ncbi:MAG TPA: PhnA domain-containing protein [Chitinophagaceae bacterium]|nr:PhnA domain-containing protein [Chitinophagaceae bacterium]
MSLNAKLEERCQGVCELCSSFPAVHEYPVSPKEEEIVENQVALCEECLQQMNQADKADYWRCLEGSIWNAEPAVQALSYRLLHFYRDADWAADVMNSVELDENVVQWAMSAYEEADVHKDAFGNVLENGDTVVLTQNLNVKGTSFSAPKGTVVKKVRLVPDNTGQIEGKINEQVIVILAKYVRKNG